MTQGASDRLLIEELRELEEFRRQYQRRHPALDLDREDPDLRRLIEALAFFAIRTRISAQQQQHKLWRRLFASYFPFLLEPMPMMGIVQAQWSPRLTDPIELERGTELRANRPGGLPIVFQTLAALRVLPVELRDVTQIELPFSTGTRLVLTFTSRFQRSDAVGALHLYPDYAGTYSGSLRLFYALRCHVRRIMVVYDGQVTRDSEGAECQVRFGAYENDFTEPRKDPDPHNQLWQARSFFHFPQQELYVNVDVPPSPRPWTVFHLCFDLGPEWPRELRIDPFTLRPFTVPVANQRRSTAVPIAVDGTHESFPILHPQPEHGFRLLSMRGVYRLAESGMLPLLPLALSAAREESGFELEDGPDLAGGHPRLRVRQPQALLSPLTLAVDAIWHQPEAERELLGALRWSLPYRSIDGLSWQPLGLLRPSSTSALGHDVETLLHMLALRMKPDLDHRGLLDVLAALVGTGSGEGFYAGFPQRIAGLSVRPVPDSTQRLSGIRHQYTLSFERYEPEDEAAVWTFLHKVYLILDAWNSDAVVDVAAEVGGSPLRLPITGDS